MEEIDQNSRQAGKQAAQRFSRLCESIKDLPPKAAFSVERLGSTTGGFRLNFWMHSAGAISPRT